MGFDDKNRGQCHQIRRKGKEMGWDGLDGPGNWEEVTRTEIMHVRTSSSLPTFEPSLVAMEMHEVMNELHALYGAWVKDQGNSNDSIDIHDIRRLSRGMRQGLLRTFEAKRLTAA